MTSATQVTTTENGTDPTEGTETETGETGDTEATEDPTTGEPTTGEPTTDGPTTDDPTDNPTTDDPTTGNPTTDNPTTDNPTTEDPTTEDPTTEDPTTGDPEQCGNGALDPGEPCDGNNLGGLSCQSLGYDNGQLACDNCTIDDAGCSNGSQPGTGYYSHCLEPDDCFNIPGSAGCVSLIDENMNAFDGMCTGVGCNNNADCPASPGGTATPVCETSLFTNMGGCLLDCSDNKTCPGGMECFNVNPYGLRCF